VIKSIKDILNQDCKEIRKNQSQFWY
jgi:hypothetical protein